MESRPCPSPVGRRSASQPAPGLCHHLLVSLTAASDLYFRQLDVAQDVAVCTGKREILLPFYPRTNTSWSWLGLPLSRGWLSPCSCCCPCNGAILTCRLLVLGLSPVQQGVVVIPQVVKGNAGPVHGFDLAGLFCKDLEAIFSHTLVVHQL